MNRKAKGSRNELKTVRALEGLGYKCTKAGGSLGVWDIIAINPLQVRLIQVKSNRKPGKDEMSKMKAFICPPRCCTKELWVWTDRVKEPEITCL